MDYIVSFNNEEYDIGGSEEGDTQDYYTDSVDRIGTLIDIVENSDPDYKLKWKKNENSNNPMGWFMGGWEDKDEEEFRVCVMYMGDIDIPIKV